MSPSVGRFPSCALLTRIRVFKVFGTICKLDRAVYSISSVVRFSWSRAGGIAPANVSSVGLFTHKARKNSLAA